MLNYQCNLQAMQKTKGVLYNLMIKEAIPDNPDLVDHDQVTVASIPTRTQEHALEVTKGDILYRLNSKYDPVVEAQRWAQQHQIKNLDTVIVMFGLGNGIFLRELMNKLDKDNLVIVYEPSDTIFHHVMENYSIEDILLDPRILIVVEGKNDYEFPCFLSQALTWMNLYSQLECIHPGYDKLYPISHQKFKEALQDNMLDNLVAKNSNDRLGRAIVENSIQNIRYIKDSISYWDLQKEIPKDIPVFIVSAGPSLQKNVDLLKEAKGKALIMAVDRAYKILIQHGIEPDVIVHMDARKPLSSCGNLPGFGIPLLCKLEGSPNILDNHKGKKIIFDCSRYLQNIYHKLGKSMQEVSTGGSVSTAAFVLCALSGFQRIVLVGSDLTYSGGLSHAGMDHLPEWNQGLIELHVEDIHGDKVKTRYDWYIFIKWFENIILQLPDIDVIDATEGGARIKGTRLLTLKEVVEEYCTKQIDVQAMIESMEPSFNIEELRAVRDYLIEGRNDLEDMKASARKVLYDCDKLITNVKLNRGASSESQRLLRNIYDTNSRIEGKPIFFIVNQYVVSANTDDIEELYFISEDKKKDELVSYTSTEKIYRKLEEACDFIIPRLDRVLEYF